MLGRIPRTFGRAPSKNPAVSARTSSIPANESGRDCAKWMLLESTRDGFPFVTRCLNALPSEAIRRRFPKLIFVSWPYAGGNNGMPDSETHFAFRHLDALLERPGHMSCAIEAAAITGAGSKEWRYFASDTETFMQQLNSALAGEPPFPIELSAFDDPDWLGLAELLPATS